MNIYYRSLGDVTALHGLEPARCWIGHEIGTREWSSKGRGGGLNGWIGLGCVLAVMLDHSISPWYLGRIRVGSGCVTYIQNGSSWRGEN